MGFLGDVTDSLGFTQFGAKKAQAKQMKYLQALFAQLQGNQAALFGQAQGAQRKALSTIKSGYGNALANTGLQANNAKRSVLDRESQQMGGLAQSLASRGLGNTTLLDNAKRGISSSTNRELSNIDSMLAQIQSQLQIGQAGAEANVYGSLSNLFQNQSSAMTGLGLQKGQALYGSPEINSNLAPGGMGQLAELFAFL